VQYIAGGATQNSIRVAQWMLQGAVGATAYMGCIGADAEGEKLKQACTKDGVRALYMVDKSTPTGACATLIRGIERSLCTNLNAANNYKVEHCKEPSNWKVVQDAKIIYSAGFFATVSPDAIKAASREKAKDGIYCMNLSAPFLMQVPPFKACFVDTMPYVDYLFGNETEARTWAETEGWDTTDVEFIATRLSLIPSATGRKRTVVITQGSEPTVVCVNGLCTKYSIIVLPKEKLVDTNGAGDSYVGGFLAGLVKGLSMEQCCKAGAYAASIIVQQSGCTFPAKCEHKW